MYTMNPSEKQSEIKPVEGREQPPSYDTLSIAPPNHDEHPATLGEERTTKVEGKKKTLREKWRELREEDKIRKANQVRYVSPEEADRITGLDKRKEEDVILSKDKPKGRGTLAAICIL